MGRFRVQDGQEGRAADAFRVRPYRGYGQPDFPPKEGPPKIPPNEVWLVTVWQDRANFESGHSHDLAGSHQELPRGLKVEAGSRSLQYVELVTE